MKKKSLQEIEQEIEDFCEKGSDPIHCHPDVTAIVPAYNEEKNILKDLEVLANSPLIKELIVVNDGSTDKTAWIVKEFNNNIRLLENKKNMGKGYSLCKGARAAANPLLFFCDADLVGLEQRHLDQLIKPVKRREVDMVVGVQERLNTLSENLWYKKIFPEKKNKSDFIRALGGEKVLWKKDFSEVESLGGLGYGIEQAIVQYFKENNKSFKSIELSGVGHVHKIKKWGFKGLIKETTALVTFVIQYIKFEIFRRR